MFDQEKRVAARMQDQARTRDVAGNELSAGKRRRRMLQKLQDKFLALFRGGIGVAERGHQPREFTRVHRYPFPKEPQARTGRLLVESRPGGRAASSRGIGS